MGPSSIDPPPFCKCFRWEPACFFFDTNAINKKFPFLLLIERTLLQQILHQTLLTDMTRSIVEPFTVTTCRPGTLGMSWIDSIIGFKLGETI